MERALKQRLLGAAVLVALAVTFLPMLVMDPAPVSGAADVPLKVPAGPADAAIETRELPLVEPTAAAGAPVVVPPASEPPADAAPAASQAMFPAATAGGDYAVSFGSYATAADADRVVASLRASQLPGYQEPAQGRSRTVHRVRIGPYATKAEAEAARLRAAHVRDDVGSKVLVLDAGAAPPDAPSTPAAAPPAPAVATAPLKPAATAPAPATPPQKPAPPAKEPATTAQPPAAPAADAVGFAVQLGAFADAAQANRLRDRARELGFPAIVEPVRTDKGELHRVRLGPVADRAEAERLRDAAASRLQITGIVRPQR